MKPGRTNYEIWLIDWLDGRLSEAEAQELRNFLELNPDLKEEFNAISSINFNPPSDKFSRKNLIRKDPVQLTDTQFELLCAGYLEGDLNKTQISELEEITSLNTEKRKIFEQIQKTKLQAPKVVFSHKRKLIKTTPFQKGIRITLVSLSAAAAIFLFFIAMPDNNRVIKQTISSTSVARVNDTSEISSGSRGTVNKITEPAANPAKNNQAVKRNEKPIFNQKVNQEILVAAIDTPQLKQPAEPVRINKIYFTAPVEVTKPLINNNLIAAADIAVSKNDSEESTKLSRFIARNFREKILGEKASVETPLKGYEIAEAGVSGLNKLFGWDMSLEKNIDTKGELNSVYFSSKLLSFNSPVKKTEPLP